MKGNLIGSLKQQHCEKNQEVPDVPYWIVFPELSSGNKRQRAKRTGQWVLQEKATANHLLHSWESYFTFHLSPCSSTRSVVPKRLTFVYHLYEVLHHWHNI